MNILGNNKDKFGFYQIGNFKTYSKVESIELHKHTGIHPHWNFNEDVFSKYNWMIEPTETIEELYKKRAQQLRNDYDYIVLFYSGGADSDNVLDTFTKNNIKLDEVASMNYLRADSDPMSMFNAEQTLVAHPKIKSLHQSGITFKHRSIDMSDITVDIIDNSHYSTNRAYYHSSHFGTNHLAKSYIRETVSDYKKLIEQGKKVVFLWGSEKPRLYQENGRYCIKFLDLLDSGVSPRTQLLNREEEYDEAFYWSPDSTDIICKQGHILKRFFEQHNIYKQDKYYSETLIKLPGIEHIFANKNTEDGLSYRSLINLLIYPGYDPKTFTVGKPTSVIVSKRDTVFNNDNYYRTQLDKLCSHLGQLNPYWHNDPSNIHKGLKLCISPAYFLH
tara:strand:+ start:2293 stop:3456 length:1164 start_codon:yes stop_codon:yes gene_type:complete